MNIRAAILWEQGAPLSVEAAELDAPAAGEVLVEVKAAGVCHSDLHPARGDWPMRTPLVPRARGRRHRARGRRGRHARRRPAITSSSAGRRRAASVRRAATAGRCCATVSRRRPTATACRRARRACARGEQDVAALPQHRLLRRLRRRRARKGRSPCRGTCRSRRWRRSDARSSRASARCSTPRACLPGATVAVIGAGGVGLNVVQGAASPGRAHHRDRSTSRRRSRSPQLRRDRRRAGAGDDASAAVRELTGGRGADYVFDTVGTPATLADALACRPEGRHGRPHRAVARRRAGVLPAVSVRDAGEAARRLGLRLRAAAAGHPAPGRALSARAGSSCASWWRGPIRSIRSTTRLTRSPRARARAGFFLSNRNRRAVQPRVIRWRSRAGSIPAGRQNPRG